MSVLFALMLSIAPDVGSPAATKQDQAKVICKKHVETGSFVKARKVCRTRAEWTRVTEFQRDEARDNADRNRGTLNGE